MDLLDDEGGKCHLQVCTCTLLCTSGRSTELAKDDGTFVFRYITSTRVYAIVLFAAVPRAVIAAFLSMAGLFFLCYTVNLEQMLLNSLALSFVLDIDEMIYPIFVPSRVQRVASRMRPFELKELAELVPG